jgi:hypothetical protein
MGKIEIPDEHHGHSWVTLETRKIKNKSHKTGCLICFACHYYKHPPKF